MPRHLSEVWLVVPSLDFSLPAAVCSFKLGCDFLCHVKGKTYLQIRSRFYDAFCGAMGVALCEIVGGDFSGSILTGGRRFC